MNQPEANRQAADLSQANGLPSLRWRRWLASAGQELALGALLLVGLFWISSQNYLLFHSLAELFSIVIAFTIFVLTWNARELFNNGYLLFLGISFLFIAGFDLLHTLAFRGMGVFNGTSISDPMGPNLATQLWLAARYMQSISLVLAPFFLKRWYRPKAIIAGFTLVSALLLFSIFTWHIFPAAYINHLTPFKIGSEYVIIFFFFIGILLLLRIREAFDPSVVQLLIACITVNGMAEFAFTEYLNTYDFFNLFGHFLKILSFYLIYKAIVDTGLRKPHDLLFRELQQSESRERARAKQMEAIIDAVPAVVRIAHDPDSNRVTTNQAGVALLGVAREAEGGSGVGQYRVYDAAGKELLPNDRVLQRVARTGQPLRDFEETAIFADGTERHLYGNATPLFNEAGQAFGAVAALIDITERVHVEQALQESEARLRRLVDSNIIGIIYCDADGRVAVANDAFLDMLGYTRADFEAGLVNWRKLSPPEYQQNDENGIQEANARGACTPYEKEYICKNGTRVPVLVGYAYFQGLPAPYIAFILNLTEQKSAEAAAAAAAKEAEKSAAEARENAGRLEQTNLRLGAANRELERANRELERANRELNDFAFVASHDLQEPLRKIQAFGERLNKNINSRIDDESQDYLARMLNASVRMRNMINDLLALSRVTTRAQPFETVNLNEVATEVLSDLEVRIQTVSGTVNINDLPAIQGDPMQMHQLLQNLIVNALKFHAPDMAPFVTVYSDCTSEPQSVRIIVEDNGIGFDETYLERIFQPFQRLHGQGQYEGSGMGLAICRKIVERHGGSITARSAPGRGSTFIVMLPQSLAASDTGANGGGPEHRG